MEETQKRHGSLFNRTSFSDGYGSPSDWIKDAKKKGISLLSFAEYNSLGSFVKCYEECAKEGIKTFPSVTMPYINSFENKDKSFSFESVIVSGFTEKGYYDLVKIKNHAEINYKNKSAYICSELVDSVPDNILIESQKDGDIQIFFPIHTLEIGNMFRIFYKLIKNNAPDKHIDKLAKKISNVIREYSTICPGHKMFVCPSSVSTNIREQLFGFISYTIYSPQEDIGMMFGSFASVWDQEVFNQFVIYRDISISFKTNYIDGAFLREESDDFKIISSLSSYKDFGHIIDLFHTTTRNFVEKINFSMKLYDFRLPHIQFFDKAGNEILSQDKFDSLIIESWNKFAKQSFDGEYTIANWGEENEIYGVTNVDQIFVIGSKRSKRLEQEYKVICELGFVEYFLIVWDIIQFCDSNSLRRNPCGRGSVAGSFIAYLLNITGIDPIDSEYWSDLLFERFLNEERVKETKSLPDIDLDFSPKTREAVVKYLRQKYGNNRICHIGTYQRLKINSAIKDITRFTDGFIPTNEHPVSGVANLARVNTRHAIQYTVAEINDILTEKNFKSIKKEQTPEEVIKEALEVSEVFGVFYGEHSNWIDECVVNICKNNRSLGVHASGFIILPDDVQNCLPIRCDAKYGFISEYEMGECEKVGFVKLDILGLKAVGMVDYAAQLIKKYRNAIIPEFSELNLQDPLVYQTIKTDAVGVFQFKSSLQRRYQARLSPSEMKHLVASVALLRTGPMKANAHEDYVAITRGYQEPVYEHPVMESVLRETGGLIIYQEQIMQLVGVMAGFTLVQADNLRRAIGKKKPEILKQQKDLFVNGCSNNGISLEIAEAVWEKIDFFSGYGFNQCLTGDSTITMPFNWEENQFTDKSSTPYKDSVKDFLKYSKRFVQIPIMYAYLARYCEQAFGIMFDESESLSSTVDYDHFKNHFYDYIKNCPDNEMTFCNAFHKLVTNPSEFRGTSNFKSSPEYYKLLEIIKSKSFGSCLGFADGVGVMNNIVDIIRLDNKQPVIHITTQSGKHFRCTPSHPVMVWDYERNDVITVPAIEVSLDNMVVCSDHVFCETYLSPEELSKIDPTLRKKIMSHRETYLDNLKRHLRNEGIIFHSARVELTKASKYSAGEFSIYKEREKELFGNELVVKNKVYEQAINPKFIDREDYPAPVDFSTASSLEHSHNYGVPCYLDNVISVDIEPETETIYEVEMLTNNHRHSNLYFGSGVLQHNSHAVSYSALGYYMAYIKTYYPAEFWCGVMRHASHSKKMSNNIYEVKDHLENIGVDVRFPRMDGFHFSYVPLPQDDTSQICITWPLSSIRDIGEKVSMAIYRKTNKSGKFETLDDFLKKCCSKSEGKTLVDLRVFKALLFIGFFDSIIPPQGNMSDSNYEIVVETYYDIIVTKFFEYTRRTGSTNNKVKNNLIQMCCNKLEKFQMQIKYSKSILKRFDSVFDVEYETTKNFKKVPAGSIVSVVGVISDVRNFNDKNGNRMSIFTLSDHRLSVRVVIFKDTYRYIKQEYEIPKIGHVVHVIGTKDVSAYGVSIVVGSDSDSGHYRLITTFDKEIFS